MREATNQTHSQTRILIDHFFRRFFDNDTVQPDGDTVTTVVRALSAVAVPGLMVAFFLQTQYPQRKLWGSIQDQYFFVLFSFAVMGAVAIFEWEMLFPDRLDFLILSPLSLKPMQLLAAKAAALIAFLEIFLFACNIFGALVLPAVSKGHFYRQVYAHSIAVLFAGAFAALFFLALGGVLLCALSAAQFRIVSPIVQMLSVMALVLLMLHYLQYGDSLQSLLTGQLRTARWIPPLWFLGIYERLLHGDAAPAFAQPMAGIAFRATTIAGAIVLLTYPLAWARMRRMAMEGPASSRQQPSRWIAALIHRIVRSPGERAAFHFISQTMARNNRYQVYLAMYCGTGLALAVACAVTLRTQGGGIHPSLSAEGLHAMLPLLLFWVIAGLRTAFAFPLNLPARWVFRITGVDTLECVTAGRRWVLGFATAVACAILIVLRVSGWDFRHLLVQAVFALALCLLLTDGFFLFSDSVPFNQPRMPGRASFPLLLTLYIGVFPPFILGVVNLELRLEHNLIKLGLFAVAAIAAHTALHTMRRKSIEIEEEMEGYEGEFQLLNLS